MEFMRAEVVRVPVDSTAVKVGCAVIAITLALIWGLVKTGQRLKKGEANRKCLLSYIFFSTGWLLHAAIAAITFQTSRPELGSIVALVVFAGFWVAGVTLAILGMSELRQSPDLLKEGKGTAILTLVLSSIVVALLVVGLSLGFLRGRERSAKILAPPGTKAVFEDLAYSIQPAAPWVRVDVSKLNPLAAVGFQRDNPAGFIMVIAEKIPAGTQLDYETFVQNVRDNLARASRGSKITDQSDEMINRLQGRRLICEANFQGNPRTFLYWLHISPEVAYQLVAFADTGDASVIVPEARRAFSTFTLIRRQ